MKTETEIKDLISQLDQEADAYYKDWKNSHNDVYYRLYRKLEHEIDALSWVIGNKERFLL